MPAEQATEIGPYKIVRPIATGGMAEIFLARQRAIEGVERTVVIKRILGKHAEDEEFITMFLDEARLLAALAHPNIAAVFDVGRVGRTYYLAMEHVRGPTLGRLLSRARESGERLPRREALGIGLSIAEALHYVHERRDEVGRPLNIVHRDLNPANVMISFDGAVKLIDFGIAKAATRVYETRTGVIKGTYGYSAPEQLAGTTVVDRRADVFALGILLYEMIVGEHPFDTSDEPNLVDRILEARYKRPRAVQPDVPRELDRLIASCLTPHPEGRPADMLAVIDAIAAHLGEQGQVPTQTALSKVVRQLVPDAEGPSPLRPLTAIRRPRPFDDPSGTRQLRLERPDPSTHTEPRRALAEPRPGGELWNEATFTFDDDEPLTLATAGVASSAAPPEAFDDATLARPRPSIPPPDEVAEEAPTRMISISDAVPKLPRDEHGGRPSLRGLPASGGFTPSRGGPPGTPVMAPKRRGVPLPALILGSAGGMLVVGLLAFVIVRAVGSSEPETPARPAPITPPPAALTELRLVIVSEPLGATVHVDGEAAPGQTPVTVTLPPGTDRVWVRVSKEGYESLERQVVASVGESVFVLSTIN